jgi:hypothetical protein
MAALSRAMEEEDSTGTVEERMPQGVGT